MLEAVDFKDGKIGVYDSDDASLEYLTIKDIKVALDLGLQMMGVTLEANLNPIYTLQGLTVNLNYKNLPQLKDKYAINVIGRFKFVLLDRGNYTGVKYDKEIKNPTVMVYDLGVNFPKMKFPSGQYVSSYYAVTLLYHNDSSGLMFDTDVDAWKINAMEVRYLKEWLRYVLFDKWGYDR